MSNPLDAYLQRTERYLNALPKELRDNELLEISSHMEMLVQDLRAEGLDEKAATREAIQRFGSASIVGKRVRDVWEGNLGWLTVIPMVVVSNWLWNVAYWFVALKLVFSYALNSEKLLVPLQPLLVLWVATTSWIIPFAWNFLLGRWGGRRVYVVAPLAFLPYLLVALVFRFITPNLTSYTSAFAPLIMAGLGAWAGSSTMRKTRFALATGVASQQASSVLSQIKPFKSLLKSVGVGLLALATVWTFAFLWAKPRIREVLHPSTPESAVRILLECPTNNLDQMKASTDISVKMLPPRGKAETEKADTERRVAYSATMHAIPAYREKRISYYKNWLQQKPNEATKSILRDALNRLKPEGYQAKGVLKVVRTNEGWEVDTSGGPENQPWAWLYDMYYSEGSA